MNGKSRTPYVLGIITLIVIAVVIILVRRPPPTPTVTARPKSVYVDCPTDTMATDSSYRLTGPYSRVPEYNDCQQFIDDRGQYGPLFGVYVRAHLGRVTLEAGAAAHMPAHPGGRQERLKEPLPCAGGPVRASRGTADTLMCPVAIVYAGGSYVPLGLRGPGFDCLYMFYRGPGATDYGAVMTAITASSDCFDPLLYSALPAGFTTLTSTFVPPPRPEYTADDYPEVGRWERDSAGTYFIDLKCGRAMCMIGSAGLKPYPAIKAPSALTSTLARRVYEIKLWYDDQVLALPGGAGPSRIHGYVFPDSGLDHRTDPDYNGAHHWLPASTILLVGGDYPKMDFRAGAIAASGQPLNMNALELCKGDQAHCIPAGSTVEGSIAGGTCPPGSHWWFHITSADGVSKYYCVKFMGHPTIPHIAGTARWHWLAVDETEWVKCPSGCCTPQ